MKRFRIILLCAAVLCAGMMMACQGDTDAPVATTGSVEETTAVVNETEESTAEEASAEEMPEEAVTEGTLYLAKQSHQRRKNQTVGNKTSGKILFTASIHGKLLSPPWRVW